MTTHIIRTIHVPIISKLANSGWIRRLSSVFIGLFCKVIAWVTCKFLRQRHVNHLTQPTRSSSIIVEQVQKNLPARVCLGRIGKLNTFIPGYDWYQRRYIVPGMWPSTEYQNCVLIFMSKPFNIFSSFLPEYALERSYQLY